MPILKCLNFLGLVVEEERFRVPEILHPKPSCSKTIFERIGSLSVEALQLNCEIKKGSG